jgi:hypothetical protein
MECDERSPLASGIVISIPETIESHVNPGEIPDGVTMWVPRLTEGIITEKIVRHPGIRITYVMVMITIAASKGIVMRIPDGDRVVPIAKTVEDHHIADPVVTIGATLALRLVSRAETGITTDDHRDGRGDLPDFHH